MIIVNDYPKVFTSTTNWGTITYDLWELHDSESSETLFTLFLSESITYRSVKLTSAWWTLAGRLSAVHGMYRVENYEAELARDCTSLFRTAGFRSEDSVLKFRGPFW